MYHTKRKYYFFFVFWLAPDTVDVLPKLTSLKDQIVVEGQPAQFKTQVSPAKPKPTIQWYREGALIPQSPDFQVNISLLFYHKASEGFSFKRDTQGTTACHFQMIHEGNNAVLLIATTYEEDTGTFTCRATTSAGTVETSAKLIVKSKNWNKDTDSIANTIHAIGLILYNSKNCRRRIHTRDNGMAS